MKSAEEILALGALSALAHLLAQKEHKKYSWFSWKAICLESGTLVDVTWINLQQSILSSVTAAGPATAVGGFEAFGSASLALAAIEAVLLRVRSGFGGSEVPEDIVICV